MEKDFWGWEDGIQISAPPAVIKTVSFCWDPMKKKIQESLWKSLFNLLVHHGKREESTSVTSCSTWANSFIHHELH